MMQGHVIIIYLINRVDGLDWNKEGLDYEMQDWCEMTVIIFDYFLINFN